MRIGIDARVVIEAAVLDRQHRFCHPRGDRFERDAAALFARPGHHRRQQRRIEGHPLERLRLRLDFAMRCGGGGGGFAVFLRMTGGSGNDTVTTLPA